MDKTLILILNYNKYQDTLECLDSVLKLNYAAFRVVVVDNHSTDNSVLYICDWAGKDGLVSKVININSLSEQADDYSQADLVIIRSDRNRGYSGGNNLGLRHFLQQGDCEYAWILNNDTVVDQEALKPLVAEMKLDRQIGICGSTLLEYNQPKRVQALAGARHYRWLGLKHYVGRRSPFDEKQIIENKATVLKRIDYISGAAMLVSKAFIEQVGLLSEDYFLYYEELDWVERSKGCFKLGYAPESIVYHREGATTGGTRELSSYFTDYHKVRSKLIFCRKYHIYSSPLIICNLIAMLIARMIKLQYDRAPMILKLIRGFITDKNFIETSRLEMI